MTDVVMPQMGESIVEGTLTKWLKKLGDRVEPYLGEHDALLLGNGETGPRQHGFNNDFRRLVCCNIRHVLSGGPKFAGDSTRHQGRPALAPRSGLLVRVAGAQHRFLIERASGDLHGKW